MSEAIKLPTWSLPVVAAGVSFLMGYAAMEATAQATVEEVARIEAVVKVTAEKAEANGTSTKLNEQAIQHITLSLASMEETARSSDAKLQTLIELMIQQSQD